MPSSDTFTALVTPSGLRWVGPAPAALEAGGSVLVDVRVREERPAAGRTRLSDALDRAADAGAFDAVGDAVAWQRRQRRER